MWDRNARRRPRASTATATATARAMRRGMRAHVVAPRFVRSRAVRCEESTRTVVASASRRVGVATTRRRNEDADVRRRPDDGVEVRWIRRARHAGDGVGERERVGEATARTRGGDRGCETGGKRRVGGDSRAVQLGGQVVGGTLRERGE